MTDKLPMTRLPHKVLLRLLSMAENPDGTMEVYQVSNTERIFSTFIEYDEKWIVSVKRTILKSEDLSRVLVDTWDLEWMHRDWKPPVNANGHNS